MSQFCNPWKRQKISDFILKSSIQTHDQEKLVKS